MPRRTEGMGPSLTVEEGTTRRVFEAYLEGVLASTLGLGQVIMMDNRSSHNSSLVAEVEEYGYALMYRSIRPSQRKVSHPHW
jgi:transposase